MSSPLTTTAEVIADRYLTSPVSLRSRPFGPVDALDTHAGRAAQVRIVFLSSEWDTDRLAETVASWCAIGTAGVIGVLDFGDHNGHPFLVLPPALGMPLERWRAMRRPGAVDAARLALGFGRLIEAIAAAGFATDVAEPTDFGVGPGPTPFLEVPLLRGADAPVVLRPELEGQALIARLYRATVWDSGLPPGLDEWADRADAQGFGSLAECLDTLEAAATVVHESRERGEPVGLAGVFDAPVIVADRVPWWDRDHRFWRSRWYTWGFAAFLVLGAVFAGWSLLNPPIDHAPAVIRPSHVAVRHIAPPAPTAPTAVKPARHHPRPHPAKRHPRRRHPAHRHHTPTTSTRTPATTPVPAAPATPTPPSNPPIGVAVGGSKRGNGGPILLHHPSFPS